LAHSIARRDTGGADCITRNARLDAPEVANARADLSACLRMAARLGFAEGICNHFSAVVPGCSDLFLVNPLGRAFEEVGPDDLLVCNYDGDVLQGAGTPEATAFHIHARLHASRPDAVAAFHTHMPNATALAMLDGPPLLWAGQTALKFYGRIATLDRYNGLALDANEGDRIARAMGAADVIFLKNHGVIVTGRSIAEAWDDLYYLERAAEVQIRAMSTGQTLRVVPHEIAQATSLQMQMGNAESANLHLESVKRSLATTR
jgi:ribulose-5-phosphate 4-epimerase/fuculose-1-phosphate aldolase